MTYSVQADIWSNQTTYTLTIPTGNDTPGDTAAAYGLADPLTITHRLGDGDRLIQEHPEPDEATFSLIAPDATTYAQLALGDPVRLQVWPAASYAGTPVTFHGRVSSLSARPHDLGVLYTVGCVDYLADLAELTVGQTDYPRERVGERLARIMADAGVAWADMPDAPWAGMGPWGVGVWYVAARGKSPTDAWSLILETLNTEQTYTNGTDELGATVSVPVTVPLGGSDGAALQKRLWFAPVITGGLLDPVTPYKLSQGPPYTKRMRYAPPARLTAAAGVYGVTVSAADSSPSTGAPIIDGGNVDIGLSFEQSKGAGLPSRITGADSTGRSITWDWQVSYIRNIATGLVTALGAPAGAQQVITQQVATGGDDPLTTSGTGICPYWRVPFPPDIRSTWSTPAVTWHAWHESTWRRPELTELLTVARANVKTPPNREWLVGQVASTVLTVEGGRPRFDIGIVPAQLDYQIQAWAQGASLGVCRMDSPALSPVVRQNLSTIPWPSTTVGSYNAAANGWAGTVPTTSNLATGGPIPTNDHGAKRFTAAVAGTPTVSGTIMQQQLSVGGTFGTKTVSPGESYSLSLYVRSSVAQKVNILAAYLKSSGAGASIPAAPSGGVVTLVPNTWTRLSVSDTLPANTDAAVVRLDVRVGTGPIAWAIGDTFDIANAMIESGTTVLGSYFDGATPAAPPDTFAWVGTANNSVSNLVHALSLADLKARDTFTDYQIVRGS